MIDFIYKFTADFTDGTEYTQNEDDSSQFGNPTAWGDVVHLMNTKKLKRLGLVSEEKEDVIYIGFLEDDNILPGQIIRNGKDWNYKNYKLSEINYISPIYFRKREFSFDNTGGNITQFVVGYEVSYEEDNSTITFKEEVPINV